MTKADIVKAVQETTNLTLKQSSDMVEEVFEMIKVALEQGDHLKLSGFGKFEVKQKADRKGRNPRTGETITITARKILTFKPSNRLRDSLQKL